MVAVVDDADYEWLSRWKWFAWRERSCGKLYAARNDRSNGEHHQVFMHREILGLKRGDKRKGDHIDSVDTLNNQRSNLRIATAEENSCNQIKPKNNTSGLKGARREKSGKWYANIQFQRKIMRFGPYGSAVEAHQKYREEAIRMHGEFARFE